MAPSVATAIVYIDYINIINITYEAFLKTIRSYGYTFVLRRCLGRCRRPRNEFPKGTRWLTVPSVPREAANLTCRLVIQPCGFKEESTVCEENKPIETKMTQKTPRETQEHNNRTLEVDVSKLIWCIYEVKCIESSKVACSYEISKVCISSQDSTQKGRFGVSYPVNWCWIKWLFTSLERQEEMHCLANSCL